MGQATLLNGVLMASRLLPLIALPPTAHGLQQEERHRSFASTGHSAPAFLQVAGHMVKHFDISHVHGVPLSVAPTLPCFRLLCTLSNTALTDS